MGAFAGDGVVSESPICDYGVCKSYYFFATYVCGVFRFSYRDVQPAGARRAGPMAIRSH